VFIFFKSLSTVAGGTESINRDVMTSPVLVLMSFSLPEVQTTQTFMKSQACGPSVGVST